MPGKSGSRRTRRRDAEQQQPKSNRRCAMAQRIAVNDRRRKQRKFEDERERNWLMMGWLSKPDD